MDSEKIIHLTIDTESVLYLATQLIKYIEDRNKALDSEDIEKIYSDLYLIVGRSVGAISELRNVNNLPEIRLTCPNCGSENTSANLTFNCCECEDCEHCWQFITGVGYHEQIKIPAIHKYLKE